MATYAGFWLRFLATVVDALVIGIVSFGVQSTAPAAISLQVALLTFVGGILYTILMNSSSYQGTLGKLALGIKVTDLAGKRISGAQATGRYFAGYLSMIILFIGYLMVAFTEKKQGLHDMLAGTLVVQR